MKPTTPAPVFQFYCTFETNFCEWQPDFTISDAEWTQQNGQNAKYGTAPLNDVTYQNTYGNYAYINSFYEGDLKTAILRSPNFDNQQEKCMEFWYQLGGPLASSLTLALRNRTNRIELWKRNGNVADIWSHAYVTVPDSTLNNNWVEFEGFYKLIILIFHLKTLILSIYFICF